MDEATLCHVLWVRHYLGTELGHDVLTRYTADDLAALALRYPHVRAEVEEPGRRVTLHPDGSTTQEETPLRFMLQPVDDPLEQFLRADEPPLNEPLVLAANEPPVVPRADNEPPIQDWPATARRGEKKRRQASPATPRRPRRRLL